MASVDPLLLLVLLLQSAMPSAQNLVVLAQVRNLALFLLVAVFQAETSDENVLLCSCHRNYVHWVGRWQVATKGLQKGRLKHSLV